MEKVFKDKYLKEGIVDDRTDIILSRNLNCTSVERKPTEIKKKKKRKKNAHS